MSDFVLNAESKGEPSNEPTLVLVHGVAGSMRIWDPVFEPLAGNRQVVRVDLLGYGYSPKPRTAYTPKLHVAAIRRTLAVRGIAPPYIMVGLSMGSTLVLEYARKFPGEVASLVMIGYPYYHDAERARAGLRHNLWAGLTIDHPLVARFYIPTVWTLGRIGVLPPRLFAGIYSEVQAKETMLNPYRAFRSNIFNSMIGVDARPLVAASMNLPRLFLHGEKDEWSPAADVRHAVAKYLKTSFVEVPNAGHNLVVLEPDTVLCEIGRFLEKQD